VNELHLFAGAGGGILGGQLLGHTTVCAVEIEKYPRQVLLQRQRDGVLPKFPIWDDVCTFDGKPWRGTVDVVCGGFPCQDISPQGKGIGINGERSGLWKEYKRIIGEIKPQYVFAENSSLLRKRGLDIVLQDLSELGYNARWGVLGSGDIKAPHQRKRMWVLASNSNGTQQKRSRLSSGEQEEYTKLNIPSKWTKRRGITPQLHRKNDGLACGLDRLKAIGNGQDPWVAATAWRILTDDLYQKSNDVLK
jgi:DNA (cytosine-5)-methyltransferase 1